MNAFSNCLRVSILLALAWVCGVARGQVSTTSMDRIKPVPATDVRIEDAFWKPRLEVIRTVSIPAAIARFEETGRIDNFVRAAAAVRGDLDADKRLPANPFDDADVYKLIEAAAHTLAWHPDPALDAKLDDLITKVAAAQEKDGYLYTARTINPAEPHMLAGAERWINEKSDSYELSNLGYLYQAAVAHFRATGKRTLLTVAIRSAELLNSTFGPGKRSIWPGHEGVEIGLVRLHEATGEKRYLDLAKFFIDERGPDAAAAEAARGRGRRGGRGNLNQSQQKAVEQIRAVGNAVDAAHLYGGMADVAAHAGVDAYRNAVDKIWADVVGRKLYFTGGIGATANDGAFGRNYLLPNISAASASAASAANVQWQQRMFQLHGDGKYVDLLERTLYNALLAGVGLDGKQFFDANPLESLGRQQRREWPPTAGGRRGNAAANPVTIAATPIGILRILAALPEYVYATRGEAVFVNLYAASTANIPLTNGRSVKLVQETDYPWGGAVKLTFASSQPAKFAVHVRIPGWARNEAIPSDLYRFAETHAEPVVVKVNGADVPAEAANGYVRIDREWTAGDIVELSLPMPVRRVLSNDQVAENVGRIALARGPIVYCLEAPGNEPAKVRSLVLRDAAKVEAQPSLGVLGYGILTGMAQALRLDEEDKLVAADQPFVATPYFAWANRGPGEMLVWIPNVDAMAVPVATPNLAATARITASPKQAGQAMNGAAAKDGIESRSSHDNSPLSHFDWWPDRSVTVTCEYTWEQPQKVKQTQLYWWDDSTTGGGCKVPASWQAFYKRGDEWVPVETSDTYGVTADQYNKVNFAPVESTALRLEIKIRDDASVGIQEWKVR